MNSLNFPSVYNFSDISDYFLAFLKANEEKSFFSHRYFANKIEWPLGYLNDVISKRRGLTINRCMQFIEFSNMDPIASERFVYLCLKNNLNEKQKKIVDQKLPKSRGAQLIDDGTKKELFHEQANHLVFSILKWCKQNLTDEQIQELSPVVSLSLESIKNARQTLLDQKIIRVSEDDIGIEFLNPNFMVDEVYSAPVSQLHQAFARSSVNYYNHNPGPATLNCGFIELPRARFKEITEKMLAFRNWLLDYASDYEAHNKRERLDETLVFQFDLNLFPVMNKALAKKMSEQ